MIIRCIFLLLTTCAFALPLSADSLPQLSRDFWAWRAIEQPFSGDDIPRIERPRGLAIDWSAEKVASRRGELAEFERRWRALRADGEPVATQVDWRLMGSALARVRWELDLEQGWRRNPDFYVEQTLGSVQELLLAPPPFGEARQAELLSRVRSIPVTVAAAKRNLTDMRRPFAQLSIDSLADVASRWQVLLNAIEPQLNVVTRAELQKDSPAAMAALTSFREWLKQKLPSLDKETAIGRENYLFFLRNVALSPFTPEQMIAMGRQELDRTVAFDAYEANKNARLPALPLLATQEAQIERERKDEQEIRAFLEAHDVLTVPSWMPHYLYVPLPEYLKPFGDMSEQDDFAGPSRSADPGIRYIPQPSPKLGYFALSDAQDPRAGTVHEGVPGHYFQLMLSWKHPDEVRRHYYDSGANEGIGFYAEEMMLQAGLFDDSPRTREMIYSYARLRALRVEVDVRLALGEFTLEQATDYLARTVPMDNATAHEEAARFASTPGQAITYQIGKLQILALLADARRKQGDGFSLRAFHDSVWLNGNVPLSLQRWEMLGDRSEVPDMTRADAASGNQSRK